MNNIRFGEIVANHPRNFATTLHARRRSSFHTCKLAKSLVHWADGRIHGEFDALRHADRQNPNSRISRICSKNIWRDFRVENTIPTVYVPLHKVDQQLEPVRPITQKMDEPVRKRIYDYWDAAVAPHPGRKRKIWNESNQVTSKSYLKQELPTETKHKAASRWGRPLTSRLPYPASIPGNG
jgi:hypothetical protein